MQQNSNHLSPESFENKLEELEKIAKNLNQNNTSLEESLVEFEKGIRLSKECQQILKKAEQKVKFLLQNDDQTWNKESDYKNS